MSRAVPYCACGATAPYDHNLGCPYAVYPKGTQTMTTIEVPAYVDPAVLKPGATVFAQLGEKEVRLTVLRVEPTLICRAPDGDDVVVFAHMVVPTDDD